MTRLNLVIGANGHLGNNLVRKLLKNGEKVRAGVRNLENIEPFKGLDCEIAYADIMDKDSLMRVMEGVDVLYIAAAVYKYWAQDIQKEIIDVNIEGTRNIIEAAAAKKVKKTIYVSSTLTCDHSKTPTDETGWNNDKTNPYVYSKTEAEKIALKLAGEYNLWMVSIVPSAMLGPNCYGHLTPSMELIANILNNQLPFDPGFRFNFVDIRDVCDMMTVVTEKGRNGQRYILAQELPIDSTGLFEFTRSLYPSVRIPPSAPPYVLLYIMAGLMEFMSKITKKRPLMLRSQVKNFREGSFSFDISRARKELGFDPRPMQDALRDVLDYLSGENGDKKG